MLIWRGNGNIEKYKSGLFSMDRIILDDVLYSLSLRYRVNLSENFVEKLKMIPKRGLKISGVKLLVLSGLLKKTLILSVVSLSFLYEENQLLRIQNELMGF
jgi:hypothetical protein